MAIAIALISIYFLRTIVFKFGFRSQELTNSSISTNTESLSIIVPARDEENNIANCINSIANSNLNNSKFDIIAINDRSSDNTQQELEALQSNFDNLKVVQILDDTQKGNLKGKAGALQIGVNNCDSDLVIMTDADCTVNENWARTIQSNFDKATGMVCSYTLIKGNRLFDKIQAIEWLFLHTMAVGGLGINQPLGCYGNNLSIRKKVFEDVGGYKNIKFSVTEDLALMQSIYKIGYKIKYICDYNATVETLPAQNLKEYLSQRKRWIVGGKSLGLKAVFFVISSLSVWLGIGWGVYNQNLELILLPIIAKFGLDAYLIITPMVKLKRSRLLPYLPLAIIFFMIMELIAPLMLTNKTVVWKGQTFKM
jgi:cellulose synthase/poly-beta-1,6-N-acetylglucosamine synthase-like glycosyltransferase